MYFVSLTVCSSIDLEIGKIITVSRVFDLLLFFLS